MKQNGKKTQQKESSLVECDSDTDVLSSTTIDTENVDENQHQLDNSSCISVDEITLSSGQEKKSVDDVALASEEQEQPVNKIRATRKRRLRPEDERTLNILAKKFRSEQNGMKCQVPMRQTKPITCSKPSNLKRHLSNAHKEIFASLFPNEVIKKKQSVN